MRKRFVVILPLLLIGILVGARLALARPIEPEPYWRAKKGTIVQRTTYYTVCGHEGGSTSLIEPRLVGLDASALERMFSGWSVSFAGELRVELEREVEAYCPRHYLLKQRGDHLAIYQNATGEGNWTMIRQLDIPLSALAPTLRTQLAQGRIFSSLEEIELALNR